MFSKAENIFINEIVIRNFCVSACQQAVQPAAFATYAGHQKGLAVRKFICKTCSIYRDKPQPAIIKDSEGGLILL